MNTREAGRSFIACFPGSRFPSISVTGESCDLMCAHCRGRYLRGMVQCRTPEELYEKCRELEARGALGVLLSGGCNEKGYVPLDAHLEAIERIKRETKLFVAAHTGLPPAWLARELGRAGIDLVDLEIIGDSRTIKLLTGLERTPWDYRRAMRKLSEHVPHVVPHICIGAHGGRLLGERRAISIAAEADPELVVFLVLTPTPNTCFSGLDPPAPKIVGGVIAEARKKISGEMALGCMRPRGDAREEYEAAALVAGVSRMELPSRNTLEQASKMGLRVGVMDACCSAPAEARGWLRWLND